MDVLHEPEDEWIGSCFYDLLHPKDIQKVKEQLACFDVEEGVCVISSGPCFHVSLSVWLSPLYFILCVSLSWWLSPHSTEGQCEAERQQL